MEWEKNVVSDGWRKIYDKKQTMKMDIDKFLNKNY